MLKTKPLFGIQIYNVATLKKSVRLGILVHDRATFATARAAFAISFVLAIRNEGKKRAALARSLAPPFLPAPSSVNSTLRPGRSPPPPGTFKANQRREGPEQPNKLAGRRRERGPVEAAARASPTSPLLLLPTTPTPFIALYNR
jgi:hypothetical protein